MIYRDPPTDGWVWGWMVGSVGQWVGLGQMTKNWINLDLIEIIQFCLKIYDLLRHPHLWVGGWVGLGQMTTHGCVCEWMVGSVANGCG